MEKTNNFNWSDFNKKIAGLRGESWRKKLIQNKLYKTEHPTAMKFRRVNLGISQREMIQRVGIKNMNTYGRIERGEAYASKERAKKIADVLNTTLPEIFLPVEIRKHDVRYIAV